MQAALRVDRKLQIESGLVRRCADHAGGGLHVLRADFVDDVGGGEAALGDLLRIEPDPHRIVARAEQLHLADALDAREPVLDVQHRVVAQIRHIVAVVRRQQVNDHRKVRRALDGGDAQRADFRRQARFGLRHPVLHELLRLVGIGAEAEGDVERHHAVGGRLAAHIEHVLDAVDLLFDWRGNRLCNHLRVGAGILRADHDGGRRDLGIFGDRQRRQRQQAGKEDQRRENAREDRSVDEEF